MICSMWEELGRTLWYALDIVKNVTSIFKVCNLLEELLQGQFNKTLVTAETKDSAGRVA